MSNDININDFLKNSPLKSVKSFLLPFFIVFLLLGSIYTVDANENAVDLKDESADQSAEVPSDDSSESEDVDKDSKGEK